jgi:hypothetical protein
MLIVLSVTLHSSSLERPAFAFPVSQLPGSRESRSDDLLIVTNASFLRQTPNRVGIRRIRWLFELLCNMAQAHSRWMRGTDAYTTLLFTKVKMASESCSLPASHRVHIGPDQAIIECLSWPSIEKKGIKRGSWAPTPFFAHTSLHLRTLKR